MSSAKVCAGINDTSALQFVMDEVIARTGDMAAPFRGGRTGLLGFFVGHVMGRTGGRPSPELVRTELELKLHG